MSAVGTRSPSCNEPSFEVSTPASRNEARAGPHLGVVRHQDQILGRPLQNPGDSSRLIGTRRGQGRVRLVELGHELVVLRRHGSQQCRSRAPGSTRSSWRVRGCGQRGELPQHQNWVRPGCVRRVERPLERAHGAHADIGRLTGHGRQVLHGSQLAPEHGHDVERGEQRAR